MCGYFCIGFIDFMLKGKSLLDDTNLFSPNDKEWQNNTKMFTMTKKIEIKKIVVSIENLENLKYTFLKKFKIFLLSVVCFWL